MQKNWANATLDSGMSAAEWLERCRSLIEEITGEARTPRELAPIKFMPGGRPEAGPSW